MYKIKLTSDVVLDSGEFVRTQTMLVSDDVGEALLGQEKAVETDDNGCWIDQTSAGLVD